MIFKTPFTHFVLLWFFYSHTNIRNLHMNLINGDMLHGAMHTGSHGWVSHDAPRMHCTMKDVTIEEIHMLILDVCVSVIFTAVQHV